ncbi:MAG: hypothetical protein IAE82_04810 [Opitutaceae bacterium]|nr:hypothetical protein [Opitutaceae bacterium]
MSNPKTSPRRPDAFALVCLGLLALYAAFLVRFSTSVAGGADSAGYLTSAKLITEGRTTMPVRTIPEWPAAGDELWSYCPLGLKMNEADLALRPTYPVGMPLLVALSARVLGWHWGPIFVNVIGAVAAVLLTFRCARLLGVSRPWAATGAASLATSPVLVFTSIQPLSDTLATTWTVAAMACALATRQPSHDAEHLPSRTSHSTAWALACGFAFAMSVLVRPTNVVIAPALALLLRDWRALLAAIGGGLPGAAFLAWYQATLYGSALQTGYGDASYLFSWSWLGPTLLHYVTALPVALPLIVPALFLLPVLRWRRAWRDLAALLGSFLTLAALYSIYLCTHENLWYLRFLLPSFPALAIVGSLAMDKALERLPLRRQSSIQFAATVVVAILCLSLCHRTLMEQRAYDTKELQRPYRDLSLWARDHIPGNAVILTLHASCSLYFYTDFPTIRSDLVGPDRFLGLRERLRASGRPAYALLNQYDDEHRRQKLIPGDWVEIHRVQMLSLWELRHSP